MNDSKFQSMAKRGVFDPIPVTASESWRAAKSLVEARERLLRTSEANPDPDSTSRVESNDTPKTSDFVMEFCRVIPEFVQDERKGTAHDDIDVFFYKTSECLIGDMFYDHPESRQEVAWIGKFLKRVINQRLHKHHEHLKAFPKDSLSNPVIFPVYRYKHVPSPRKCLRMQPSAITSVARDASSVTSSPTLESPPSPPVEGNIGEAEAQWTENRLNTESESKPDADSDIEYDDDTEQLASFPKAVPLVLDPFHAVARTMCRAQLHNMLQQIQFPAYVETLQDMAVTGVSEEERGNPLTIQIKVPKAVLLYLPPVGAEPKPSFYAPKTDGLMDPTRPISVAQLVKDRELNCSQLVIKSVPASGSSESHSIMILPPFTQRGKPAPNPALAEKLLRTVLPPGVFYVSKYVHHPQRVYKVYVLHPHVFVAARASVPPPAVPGRRIQPSKASDKITTTDSAGSSSNSEEQKKNPGAEGENYPLVFDSQRMEFFHLKKEGPTSFSHGSSQASACTASCCSHEASSTSGSGRTPLDRLCGAPGVARLLSFLPVSAFDLSLYDNPDSALSVLKRVVLGYQNAFPQSDELLDNRIRQVNELGLPINFVASADARAAFAFHHAQARASSEAHQAKVQARRQRKVHSLIEHAKAMQEEASSDPLIRRRQHAIKAALASVAKTLQSTLNLTMFGFDAVECVETGDLYIVDVNYFPSFQSMEEVPRKFAELILREHLQHCARNAAQFVASTLALPLAKRASKSQEATDEKEQTLKSALLPLQVEYPFEGSLASAMLAALPVNVAIVEYGSLLSENSSRMTCKGLFNFQPALVSGFSRVFSLASINNLKLVREIKKRLTGGANRGKDEEARVTSGESGTKTSDEWWLNGPCDEDCIAAVSVLPVSSKFFTPPSSNSQYDEPEQDPSVTPLLVSLFWIQREELVPYLLREQRYQFTTVEAYSINREELARDAEIQGHIPDGVSKAVVDASKLPAGFELSGLSPRHLTSPETGMLVSPTTAVICTESTDKLLRLRFASMLHYFESLLQHYPGKVWANESLKPGTRYLQFCLRAAYELAGEWGYQNFVKTSYLADSTPLSEYVEKYPRAFSIEAVCAAEFQMFPRKKQAKEERDSN